MLNTSATYKLNIYAPIREFKGRATIDLLGDNIVCDDNIIVKMNVLEEMSTLNDSVPSNEVQLTVTNESGAFDLLNFQNMHQIIASKPVITTELGLVLLNEEAQTFISNFENKVAGSTVENPNIAKRYGAGALISPTTFATELDNTDTLTGYSKLYTLNTSYAGQSAGAGVAGRQGQHLFGFDIIAILTNKFGIAIWEGKTATADKVAIARTILKRVKCKWYGYGTHPTGYKANLMIANTSGVWSTQKSHTSSSRQLLELPTTSFSTFLWNSGFMYWNAFSEPSTVEANSVIWTDYVEVEIELNAFTSIEWMKTGKFFLTEWKNEITNKIVSMVGRDSFSQMSEMSYEPTGITDLRQLAQDVLHVAGVPAINQKIDMSLSGITVRGFPERIDCRTAIQHIGIASVSAVGQDRDGNVFIKPFRAIDESSNYITYPTTQPSLYGYVGSGTYPLNDSGGGMKYIDFDAMYNEPTVSLEKSIYQVVIKVYSDIEGEDPIERLYTNLSIQGTGGASFTIDNPLINSVELADKVANWYIREINYNAIYQVNWRQNPALECADTILVEDSFGAEKQTRIIRQEFNYEGYLQGRTESRGGV